MSTPEQDWNNAHGGEGPYPTSLSGLELVSTESLVVSGAMELVDQTVGSAIASASFSLSNLGTLATRDSAGVIDLGEGFN